MLTKNKIEEELEKFLPEDSILSSLEECYVYSQDGTNTRKSEKTPDVVIFPETIEEVQQVVKFANIHEIPVTARGAGTNLIGACLPDSGGIVMNFSKMNTIKRINKTDMTAIVQPGVVVGDLQKAVEKIGLFFPPDPSNLRVSTIGGAIAQSAGGPKTFKYGTTKDYILGLKVVLADGSLMITGSNTIKNATGYPLSQLFVGSEGTLGIVVEATLKLIPKPETSRVMLAYFDSINDATVSVNNIIDSKLFPSTIDFMDNNAINTVEKFYPANLKTDKTAALIIEIEGSKDSVLADGEKLKEVLLNSNASGITISDTQEEYERIWTARRASFAATAKLRPDVVTDDMIVPRSNLPKLVEGINAICEKYHLQTCVIGHVGDGNVHPQIALNLEDKQEYANYIAAKNEMYKLTIKLGGTLSGEHGIGSEKKKYIPMAVDKVALEYMRKIKTVFDPKNILNPDKIF